MAENKNETEGTGKNPAKPPEKPTETPKATPDGKKTPREWALAKGHFIARRAAIMPQGAIQIGPGSRDRVFAPYAAAAELHGWNESEHHYQGDSAFRVSERDYDDALVAASAFPAVAAHTPAIAPITRIEHDEKGNPVERKLADILAGMKPKGFATGASLDLIKERIRQGEQRFRKAVKTSG